MSQFSRFFVDSVRCSWKLYVGRTEWFESPNNQIMDKDDGSDMSL